MRPKREHLTNYRQTQMVMSETWRCLPDHVDALITFRASREKAVEFVKHGFAYRGKRELGSSLEIGQKGFRDHRIRAAKDCARPILYIPQNPVRKHLSEVPEPYSYASAHPGFDLDEAAPGLKPNRPTSGGAAEAAPPPNNATEKRQLKIFSHA